MRKFSEKEKEVIIQIVCKAKASAYNTTNLAFIFDEIFKRHSAKYKVNGGRIVYVSTSNKEENERRKCINVVKTIESELLGIYAIRSLLIDERLIMSLGVSENDENPILGTEASGFIKCFDNSIVSSMLEEAFCDFYVTEELISLVDRHFKTYEEITLYKAEEQMRNSVRQLKISYIMLLLSIITTFLAIIRP